MRTHTGGSTVMALSLKRKSPGALTAAPSSNVLVRIVEKSILRSLAFVLYHLERAQARACARSILQWYEQLQRRLPLFAVDSLERFATSFVALSDAEFTAFWLSLVAEPGATPSGRSGQHTAVSIDTVEGEGFEDDPHERDATLVKRLYRQICCRIQRLFGLPTCVQPRDDELLHAQTPLTSPDDKFYHERQLYVRRASLSLAVRQASVGASSSGDYYDYGHGSRDATAVAAPEPSEPGWAVEYMEQESRVSSEITLRMRRMMHSSIPLNLFRVAVVYPANGDDSHDDDALLDAVGFVGVVSPESFPPTPITRDLQTRRIHHYTATVLDHATLALRLLDANYAG